MGKGLRARLDEVAWKQCIPVDATIELGLACNLRCAHCYNFDRRDPSTTDRKFRTGFLNNVIPAKAGIVRSTQAEKDLDPRFRGDDEETEAGFSARLTSQRGLGAQKLSLDTVRNMLDELASLGTLWVYLTGGEALLYPHLEAVVAHARKQHMRVGIKTHGMGLRSKARKLVDAGVDAFDVSLYGDKDRHDDMTGKPGSFEATLEGLRVVAGLGAQLQISVTLTKHSVDDVDTMQHLADEVGARLVLNTKISSRYDGDTAPRALQLTQSQLRHLYQGPLREHIVKRCTNGSVQCGCARNTIAIASNGDVYPCMLAPKVAGNIFEQGLTDIWWRSPVFANIRGLTLKDFEQCEPCALRSVCRRSSGVVYANTGNYTGNDAFTCMEAAVINEVIEDGHSRA